MISVITKFRYFFFCFVSFCFFLASSRRFREHLFRSYRLLPSFAYWVSRCYFYHLVGSNRTLWSVMDGVYRVFYRVFLGAGLVRGGDFNSWFYWALLLSFFIQCGFFSVFTASHRVFSVVSNNTRPFVACWFCSVFLLLFPFLSTGRHLVAPFLFFYCRLFLLKKKKMYIVGFEWRRRSLPRFDDCYFVNGNERRFLLFCEDTKKQIDVFWHPLQVWLQLQS